MIFGNDDVDSLISSSFSTSNLDMERDAPTRTSSRQYSTGNIINSDNLPARPPSTVVTIPVPVIPTEGTFVYIAVKGSLHDTSCAVFGLNHEEVQAIKRRFDNSVKRIVNGVMVTSSPLDMLNALAQLGYKVISSCGEAEISWTLQRES